jgi:hypothetical protein
LALGNHPISYKLQSGYIANVRIIDRGTDSDEGRGL